MKGHHYNTECPKCKKLHIPPRARARFPELRSRLPSLWTRSYFVSTHGHVSSETIRKYVEEQKGI